MTRSRSTRGNSRKSAPARTSDRAQNRNNMQSNNQARTPLLPVGVNNKATMPWNSSEYHVQGEEVISVLNVASGSTAGQTVFNALITPQSARRLGILSNCWQRIDWKTCSLNLVALNGSTVTSGYTMGWVEDPEAPVPDTASELISYLTALRATTVRQNWVQSEAGCQVNTPDKPEMYTQLGSDVRRYSPGRLVIVVAGDVSSACTFQLMLRYRVRLYVPFAGVNAVDPGVPGLRGTWPTATNVSVSTTTLTYPGLGTGFVPGTTRTCTTPLAVMEAAAPSPSVPVRIFPRGTRVTLNPLGTTGGSVSVGIEGATYWVAIGQITSGQFRAFTPLEIPVTGLTNATTLVWT
ncbi:hypothetical protein 3 [Hubei tombus-like virus 15]|uniref:hypothetical protein 3 n=1 Tax=Hubei tombus-like virus 15 TaxID=1923261 RepID=UPI00090AE8EB|nr:hypothetical protein 3 [Hubei tombus-like virus 15]APG76575.1 hypothetical protein 3 [Hubei tombus-like virus 15]